MRIGIHSGPAVLGILGKKQIKGKSELVEVFRVIAPSTRKTRFDVSPGRGLTHFVGRERELKLLLDGFERQNQLEVKHFR